MYSRLWSCTERPTLEVSCSAMIDCCFLPQLSKKGCLGLSFEVGVSSPRQLDQGRSLRCTAASSQSYSVFRGERRLPFVCNYWQLTHQRYTALRSWLDLLRHKKHRVIGTSLSSSSGVFPHKNKYNL